MRFLKFMGKHREQDLPKVYPTSETQKLTTLEKASIFKALEEAENGT